MRTEGAMEDQYTSRSSIRNFKNGRFVVWERISKKIRFALAEWLSWLGHYPVHQKVADSIPHQGTLLGCRLDPRLGHVRDVTD